MAFWSDSRHKEPLRQHRWYLTFQGLGNDNNKQLDNYKFALKECKKPEYEITVTEHRLLSHTFRYPGNLKWKPITIKFASAVGGAEHYSLSYVLAKILESSKYGSPVNGKHANISKGLSSFDILINQVDPDGNDIETWTLSNCFINTTNFGSLSYENEGIVDIEISVQYDYATLKVARTEQQPPASQTRQTRDDLPLPELPTGEAQGTRRLADDLPLPELPTGEAQGTRTSTDNNTDLTGLIPEEDTNTTSTSVAGQPLEFELPPDDSQAANTEARTTAITPEPARADNTIFENRIAGDDEDLPLPEGVETTSSNQLREANTAPTETRTATPAQAEESALVETPAPAVAPLAAASPTEQTPQRREREPAPQTETVLTYTLEEQEFASEDGGRSVTVRPSFRYEEVAAGSDLEAPQPPRRVISTEDQAGADARYQERLAEYERQRTEYESSGAASGGSPRLSDEEVIAQAQAEAARIQSERNEALNAEYYATQAAKRAAEEAQQRASVAEQTDIEPVESEEEV